MDEVSREPLTVELVPVTGRLLAGCRCWKLDFTGNLETGSSLPSAHWTFLWSFLSDITRFARLLGHFVLFLFGPFPPSLHLDTHLFWFVFFFVPRRKK